MRVWLHQGIHEQQCCEAQYLMLLVYGHEQTETRLLKQVLKQMATNRIW